ncbi:Eco57I restriction-modification methylase domain-containing protein [Moraxella equi]|uniref:Eco57I restriction-modification methylase domain-containing protein n=1 Tax=Moraxella equi TaxID=60442 RepID=UPI001E34B5B0
MTICDPACGSGAFLNEALNYLIDEHHYIDELESKLTDSSLTYQNISNHILENNLFGVDINSESVEIAKLSLWLRTAEPHRKLSNLNQNIKCGNSLIDDDTVAGDKAFDWQKEFPKVFEKGGFDVVIGNPPYFNVQTLGAKSSIVHYLQNEYDSIWQDKSDILFYFIKKAMQISKDKIGYIVSNAFLFSDKAQKLRNEIITDNRLSTVVNFERYMIFEDASITSCVILFEKDKDKTKVFLLKDKNYEITDIANFIDDDKNAFEVNFEMNNVFALVNDKIAKINQKIDGSHRQLQDIILIGKGMETACNSVFSFDYFPKQFPKEFIRKQMIGENINPYRLNSSENYLLYSENVDNFDDLPKSIQEHLISNQDILKNRATVKNEGRIWYRYARPMHKDCYHLNKIWCSYRSSKNAFVLDESSDYIGLTNTTVIFDTNADIDLKYLLSILNSKLFSFVISPLESKRVVAFLNFLQVGLVNFPFQKY